MRTLSIAFFLIAVSLAACGDKTNNAGAGPSPSPVPVQVKRLDFPATPEGAKSLVGEFVKPGADLVALTKGLQPDSADYKSVFEGASADKVEKSMTAMWGNPNMILKPNEGQTDTLVNSQTTDEMKSGNIGSCPGGYKDAALQMKSGITVYCFKFVKPGETSGMAFDGLMHVNGHWAIFPKPWRALK